MLGSIRIAEIPTLCEVPHAAPDERALCGVMPKAMLASVERVLAIRLWIP
jgi:hypothetical protein